MIAASVPVGKPVTEMVNWPICELVLTAVAANVSGEPVTLAE